MIVSSQLAEAEAKLAERDEVIELGVQKMNKLQEKVEVLEELVAQLETAVGSKVEQVLKVWDGR